MTGKRFTDDGIEDIENQSLTDNLTEKTYWIDHGLDEIVELLNKFNDDNEELKERNDRQAKQLDRLYNLIEEKNWRALYDIIDDFKRCEEQLQKEWGTYGD